MRRHDLTTTKPTYLLYPYPEAFSERTILVPNCIIPNCIFRFMHLLSVASLFNKKLVGIHGDFLQWFFLIKLIKDNSGWTFFGRKTRNLIKMSKGFGNLGFQLLFFGRCRRYGKIWEFFHRQIEQKCKCKLNHDLQKSILLSQIPLWGTITKWQGGTTCTKMTSDLWGFLGLKGCKGGRRPH